MKRNYFWLTFALLCVPLCVFAQEKKKIWHGEDAVLWEGLQTWQNSMPTQEITLWPGDNAKLGPNPEGQYIEARWYPATPQEWDKNRGALILTGPKSTFSVDPLPVPTEMIAREGVSFSTSKTAYYYLDDMAFQWHWRRMNNQEFLVVGAVPQPHAIRFASPRYEGINLYLSSASPISLNQYNLRLSDRPVTFPDGKKGYQLFIEDVENEVTTAFRAGPMTTRQFGRFTIDLDLPELLFDETKTVRLRVHAEPDLTAKGAEAYVEQFAVSPGDTYAQVLDAFASQYGLSIEWGAAPGHPESVEYIKQLTFNRPYKIPDDFNDIQMNFSYRTVKRSLEALFNSDTADNPVKQVELEWEEATRLRVWPKNHDLYMKQKNEEDQLERSKDAFLQSHPFTTKIYKMQNIQAETARTLIGKEIKIYTLVYNPSAAENERFQLKEKDPAAGTNVIDHLEEFAVADPRTNSVIVSALEATHERVSALLREMDQMVQPPKSTVPPTAYRLEVILFECAKAPVDVPRRSAWLNPETPPGPELQKTLEQRIEGPVNARDVDIQELLSLIARQTNLKYQIDPEIHAKVTFELQNPTVRELLDHILPAQDLGFSVADDQTLRIERKSGSEPLEIQRALDKTMEGPYIARNQQLQTIVTLLSDQSGLQFVLGQGLNPPVSFSLDNPSVRQILDTVLPAHGLEYTIKDGVVVIQAAGMDSTPRTLLYDPAELRKYGITPEDLELFGFNAVAERGKGVVSLIGEKNETGQVVVSLTENYTCQLQFVDYREPYLILKGSLTDAASSKTLLENTLYLESGKPSLLGITNLNQALILVLRRH
ncbi:MAG: hypothetical protein ACE15F_24360 [bacterium]